ncbi:MAG TPA: NUMOD1 domain-containing DNA-binding protein [Mucilaginibacter sp.]
MVRKKLAQYIDPILQAKRALPSKEPAHGLKRESPLWPYQNTSLTDMPNEQWKDIPRLEHCFLISNYGRIKRLSGEVQINNGAILQKPDKIIKSRSQRAYNKYKGDYVCSLCCSVSLDGTLYHFTLTRVVYYCFVEKFNMDDGRLVVLCKDGNNFNLQPANLVLSSHGEKQQRMIKRGRFRAAALDYSKELRAIIVEKTVVKTSKRVSQYDMDGRKVKTFSSLVVAQKATGIHAVSISASAKGKQFSAGGFIWRLGNVAQLNVERIKAKRQEAFRRKNGQQVTQYDATGRRIAQYPSLQDAEEATGASAIHIGQAIKGKHKSVKGYIWKKGYGRPLIDLSHYKWGDAARAAKRTKKVTQYSLQGQYLQTFDCVKAAAIAIMVSPSSITGACRGDQKTSGGYIWKYK